MKDELPKWLLVAIVLTLFAIALDQFLAWDDSEELIVGFPDRDGQRLDR